MITICRYCMLIIWATILLPWPLLAQDDVADIPSQDLRAGNNENMRYFLIGPRKGVEKPEQGYGLLIVLPGGDGSAEFHPFVKRIYKYALPENFLIAQPVAIKWTAMQKITWPTVKNKVPGQKFSTEDFVDAIIKDVSEKYKLNPAHIFTLSWSSGGPAAYAISLSNEKVTGSFIAMSVFKPSELPPLGSAKGRAYFIYHSPQDKVCPLRMAQQAAKVLEENGAKVKFATYEGGHGWKGPLYNDISAGIGWLEENRAKADISNLK
jgi:predicted esterase